MNYKKVFETLLKPEITDEEIKEVYDFTKNNQYDQKKFNNFFIKKLGFNIDDKKNPPTPEQLEQFMKLVRDMNMKDMLDILETPDDRDKKDIQKDIQQNKRSNKRSNKKKKKRTKNQKKKSGGNADINKLFKNIKSFPAYKKVYRELHRLLHNYFKVEKIPKSKMKQHFFSLKPLKYVEIFNNPKYQ
jgi:hypothetical protein